MSQRRLVWLLWLVLLLPVAQFAAAWHGLSHARVDASTAADVKHALHPTHCDLCLIAAVVGGGAPLVEPKSLTHATARHAPPQPTFASVWVASPVQAYRSRAPPPVSR